MPAVRKTITVTEQQDTWIAEQVAAGRFTNDSELIRDLIRREQQRIDAASFEPDPGHDIWFRAQVQAAMDKAASPQARFSSLDEVASRVRERATHLSGTG